MGANLKEVRERIKTVNNTQQITKAMKMVSAAKLRKAQQAILQLRPYANKLSEMLVNILSNLEGDASSTFGVQRSPDSVLIVVVTSNKGLCGAFNSNVIKAATALIQGKYAEQRAKGRLRILCIGKKGYDFFRKTYKDCRIMDDYVHLFNDLSFEQVKNVANLIMTMFEEKHIDRVEVAYGRFKNPGTQFPEAEQFLPVQRMERKSGTQKKADYIFEPGKEELLEDLIPTILQTQFYRYLLDTHASEHGARMTAMDKATENAEGLMKELRITYNKARQEAITKELSEIVGGAAALGG